MNSLFSVERKKEKNKIKFDWFWYKSEFLFLTKIIEIENGGTEMSRRLLGGSQWERSFNKIGMKILDLPKFH